MVGAALPWQIWSTCFNISGKCGSGYGYTTGLELSRSSGFGMGGMCTAPVGGILLLIALVDRGKPGKIYSMLATIVSVLCGLLLAGTASSFCIRSPLM